MECKGPVVAVDGVVFVGVVVLVVLAAAAVIATPNGEVVVEVVVVVVLEMDCSDCVLRIPVD